MSGGKARIVALGLALCLGGPVALAAEIVDPASARRAIENPVVAATDARLVALAASRRASDLAASLDLIASDRSIQPVAQEWLLDRSLHALAALEPTPRARATAVRLAGRVPIVYTRVDPDHGERATPLYDVGATARFVLRTWERNAARDSARADLLAGRTSALDRYAMRSGGGALDPVRAGIADAFRAAPQRQLTAQRAVLLDALLRGRRVDALALILAERLADAEMFGRLFGYADEPAALAAVSSVARALDPGNAFEQLVLASRRADIASAAVLAIGRLARDDAAPRRFLFEAIGEPDIGPSAAAALATLADPAVAAELGRRLADSRTEDSRRLLVLALKLDAGAGARAELARFAATPQGSAELRKEVRRWLAH